MGAHNHWKGSGPAHCKECAKEQQRSARANLPTSGASAGTTVVAEQPVAVANLDLMAKIVAEKTTPVRAQEPTFTDSDYTEIAQTWGTTNNMRYVKDSLHNGYFSLYKDAPDEVRFNGEEIRSIVMDLARRQGPSDNVRGEHDYFLAVKDLYDKYEPVQGTRSNPFGDEIPPAPLTVSMMSKEQAQRFTDKFWAVEESGVPGDFTDEEVGQLRQWLAPTAKETSLLLHTQQGRIDKFHEVRAERIKDGMDPDDASLGMYALNFELTREWNNFEGTPQGAEFARNMPETKPWNKPDITGKEIGRHLNTRRFTRVTGIAWNPAWDSAEQGGSPPSLAYANGCDCSRFKWTGRCQHRTPELARDAAMRDAVQGLFDGSSFGKKAQKAGIVDKPKGRIRRFFTGE